MVPEYYKYKVIAMKGEEGKKWIDSLPFLVQEFSEKWNFSPLKPFPNLTYNFVLPVIRADQTKAVLKIGLSHEFRGELEAVKSFKGSGCVELYEHDIGKGTMLLEYVAPGTPLVLIQDDDEATRIAANVMKSLYKPYTGDYQFSPVEEWAKGFARMRKRCSGGSGPLPANLTDKAEKLYGELCSSQKDRVLLHGDLHHTNILSSERAGWLVIDPKGMLGEREFELGTFLRNPYPEFLKRDNPRKITERRISILSEELGLNKEKVRLWAFSLAVLSAWWDIEDNTGDGSYSIRCAEIFDAISF